MKRETDRERERDSLGEKKRPVNSVQPSVHKISGQVAVTRQRRGGHVTELEHPLLFDVLHTVLMGGGVAIGLREFHDYDPLFFFHFHLCSNLPVDKDQGTDSEKLRLGFYTNVLYPRVQKPKKRWCVSK